MKPEIGKIYIWKNPSVFTKGHWTYQGFHPTLEFGHAFTDINGAIMWVKDNDFEDMVLLKSNKSHPHTDIFK